MLKFRKLSNFENKPTEYILKKYLPFPKGTVGMISGRGGSAKTMLSVIISLKYIEENKNKNVCTWFSEDDGTTIKNRAISLYKSRIVDNIEDINNIINITSDPQHILTVNRDGIKINEELLKELKLFFIENNIGVFILDPLIAFFGGDENDNAQAKSFMQELVNLARELNINIIVLHHATKSESKARGAGAFTDAIRTLYELSNPINDDLKPDIKKYKEGKRLVRLAKDNRNCSLPFNDIGTENFIDNNLNNFKIVPDFIHSSEIKKVQKYLSTKYEELKEDEKFDMNNLTKKQQEKIDNMDVLDLEKLNDKQVDKLMKDGELSNQDLLEICDNDIDIDSDYIPF